MSNLLNLAIVVVVSSALYVLVWYRFRMFDVRLNGILLKLSLEGGDLQTFYNKLDVDVNTCCEDLDISFSSDLARLEQLAPTKTNGYDLLRVIYDKHSRTPIHKHTRAVEMFYVLSGSVTITLYDQKLNSVKAVVLTEDEYFLVKNGVYHSIESQDGAKILIIAKPKLFSRVGTLYDWFKRIFTGKKS